MALDWARNNPFARADRSQTQGTPPQNSNQQGQQGNQNQNGNEGGPGSFLDPKKTEKTNQEGDDPLLKFDTLWEPNKNEKGEVIPDSNQDDSSYLPAIDPKKLQSMVDTMDFTTGITAEEVEAIKTGGEGALGALGAMINRAGRKSFLSAFQASNKIAEQGFTKAQERFMKNIPSHVRDMMVENGLSSDIGITDNPAFQPLVKSVKEQFLKKYPKATPDQVRNGVKQYFSALEGEFTKAKNKGNSQENTSAAKLRQGAPDANFEEWLGEEIANMSGGMFQDGSQTSDDDSN